MRLMQLCTLLHALQALWRPESTDGTTLKTGCMPLNGQVSPNTWNTHLVGPGCLHGGCPSPGRTRVPDPMTPRRCCSRRIRLIMSPSCLPRFKYSFPASPGPCCCYSYAPTSPLAMKLQCWTLAMYSPCRVHLSAPSASELASLRLSASSSANMWPHGFRACGPVAFLQ